jgi:predicted nuclease with TOPRIM domain
MTALRLSVGLDVFFGNSMLNDAAKLSMFDDLQETAEELRRENDELKAELERCDKRFNAMAWSLECLVRMAKDLPEPKQEESAKKQRRRASATI